MNRPAHEVESAKPCAASRAPFCGQVRPDLPDTWRTRAQLLRDLAGNSVDDVAAVFDRCARELIESAEDLLPLKEASDLSGYSVKSLKRLLDNGDIPNRERAWGGYLIRRGDLPRKPGHGIQRIQATAGGESAPQQIAPRPAPVAVSRRQIARAVVSGESI